MHERSASTVATSWSPDRTDRNPVTTTAGDFLLTLGFLGFFLIQLVHHQLWRDELNAWGLVVASPTLKVLVDYVHNEGHPLLWYLLLWFPARFTVDPVVLKAVEGLVGCGIYFILGLWSPFSRLEKALIFLSYFVIFEYTVLARMYGICLLVMLLYVYRRSKYPEGYIGNALCLGILASADSLGVMLSGALLGEYAWSQASQWHRSRSAIPWRSIGSAFSLYLLLLSLSVWSGLPSRYVSRASSSPIGTYARDGSHFAVAVTNAVVVPWLPIQHGFVHHYWPDVDVQLQLFILVPVILFAYYLIFRKQPNLLLLVGIALAESIAFDHLVYEMRVRHFGLTFLAFLAALWLQRWNRPAVPDLGKFMLAVNALSGLTIAVLLWTRPFSNTPAAVQWLRAHHLQNAVLVGSRDFTVASVAEELNRPIYFLDCNCSDTFLQFVNRRDAFHWEQIPDRLAIAQRRLHASEMIFLSSYQLDTKELNLISQRHLHISEIAQLDGAGVPLEDYYIYRIT